MTARKKKVCILGSGAMGCLYGGALASDPSLDVWFIARDEKKSSFLNEQGITILEEGMEKKIPVRSFPSGDGFFEPDYLLVFVKAHQTADAFRENRSLFTDHTRVLTLQNGLGGSEFFKEHVDHSLLSAGISNHNSTLLSPGRILHGGRGRSILGELFPEGKACAREFALLFRNSFIPVEYSSDIRRSIWEKLLVNLAINPLTMLYQVKNGQILQQESLRNEAEVLVKEALCIAAAEGIKFEEEEALTHVFQVAEATSEGRSSMLQDRLLGRKTEIDAINGAVIALARKHGIALPHNDRIVSLVHEVEEEN